MVLWQAVFTGLVLLILWYWRNWKYVAMSWKLPGPFSLHPFGCIFTYPKLLKYEDALVNLSKLAFQYPNLFRFWLGPYFIVAIREPEEVKCFLASKGTARKSVIFDLWAEIMGTGLLSGSGPIWKFHRRLVNPTFNLSSLKSYQSVYIKNSEYLVKCLEKYCESDAVDVVRITYRCTGDILAEAVFKVDSHFRDGNMDDFIHAVDEMGKTSFQRMTQLWLHPRFIFELTNCGRRGVNANIKLKEYAMMIIQKTQEDTKKGQVVDDPSFVANMLQNLKEGNGVENIDEICEELQNIFSAGMDTTGTLAAFLLLMLAIHKDSQRKLVQEIEETFADDPERDVKLADIYQMKYLDWCIKEVCRLFSVGWLSVRDLEEDVHIKSAQREYTIPIGSSVVISNHLLHIDPASWVNPEEFMPERFSEEESSKRHPYAYLPFGGGARQCIGLKFGADSMKYMMIYVLRKYELHSDWKLKDIPLVADISVRSLWGYKIKFSHRK